MVNPPPIKLLALDLDDTLLNRDREISVANRRALAAAERRGVLVVLASGRPMATLYGFAKVLGLDRRKGHLISMNGGLIVESDTGDTQWSAALEPSILAELWEHAKACAQPIHVYDGHEILVNLDNGLTREDGRLNGLPTRVVERDEFLGEPRVKVVLPGSPEDLDPIEARFKAVFHGRANMCRSKPYLFEIMPPDADKGLALARIATLRGLGREAVMAIGDSWNDAGMLGWAGVSIAMANGVPEIRSMATWVTTRGHDEDGVAEAIEKFILDR